MSLVETILNANGGRSVSQLANQFGLTESQTSSAIEQLMPGIAAGLHRNIGQGGLQDLLQALNSGNHQQYLENPSTLASEQTVQEGNSILGHILGSKDVSRQVAASASTRTGIGENVLKRMLPVVAAMAMGALSKTSRGQSIPGAQASAGGAGILGMLTPLLDKNRDGSIADDLLGGLFGRRS